MLWLLREYWETLVAFYLFGVFHSITAREPFKNALARRTSPFFVDHFWRLSYCLISFLWTFWGVPLVIALVWEGCRHLGDKLRSRSC